MITSGFDDHFLRRRRVPGHQRGVHRDVPFDQGEGDRGTEDGRFDAIVVDDLLGRIDEARAVLGSLKGPFDLPQ